MGLFNMFNTTKIAEELAKEYKRREIINELFFLIKKREEEYYVVFNNFKYLKDNGYKPNSSLNLKALRDYQLTDYNITEFKLAKKLLNVAENLEKMYNEKCTGGIK